MAPEFVGDKDTWHIPQTLRQSLEEALRSACIAAARHQNIEHNTILVDGTPEVLQYTSYPNEHLIEVSLVTRPGSPTAKLVGEVLSELRHGREGTGAAGAFQLSIVRTTFQT